MPRIDLTNYEGREQAYVKHCLLEKYLPDLIYKVGATWDSIVYIDGFAGPWQTKDPDYADSSFAIAVDALRRCQTGLHDGRGRDLRMDSILVDQEKGAFAHLKKFAAIQTFPGFGVHALCGEFVEMIPAIEKLIKEHANNPFRFVFLDPHGWSDIPMLRLQSFLRHRSCEVLINLMTRHIIRFLKEPDRSESYHSLFGRQSVLETLRNTSPSEREDQAVWEYCNSLKLLCDFAYVSSAVILEPDQESIRYFLVYATNHPRGVEVFKSAETQTANIQDNIRHETHIRKTGQPDFLFDSAPPSSRLVVELRKRYTEHARTSVLKVLSANISAAGVRYSDLFCEAMAFPLVTPDDLIGWLRELEPNVIKIQFERPNFKKPSPSRNDRVVVINPKRLNSS